MSVLVALCQLGDDEGRIDRLEGESDFPDIVTEEAGVCFEAWKPVRRQGAERAPEGLVEVEVRRMVQHREGQPGGIRRFELPQRV